MLYIFFIRSNCYFIHISYIWYTWIKMYINICLHYSKDVHLLRLCCFYLRIESVILEVTRIEVLQLIPCDFLILPFKIERSKAFFFLSYHDFPLYHVSLKRKNDTLEIFYFNVFLLDTSIRNKLKKCILLVTGDSV